MTDVACNWCAEYVMEDTLDPWGCCSDGCAVRYCAYQKKLADRTVISTDLREAAT